MPFFITFALSNKLGHGIDKTKKSSKADTEGDGRYLSEKGK